MFDGKRIVISGGSAGIGKATALAAQRRGAAVTSLDINDTGPEKVRFKRCDVSSLQDWNRVSQEIEAPDYLFLNAGVMSAVNGSPKEDYAFDHLTLQAYRRVVSVNIDGVVFGLMAFLPKMPHGSSVLAMASLAGVNAYDHDPIYAMTKHAVVGLVRSLAPSLEDRRIRLNALCPNRVATDLLPLDQRHRDCLTPEIVANEALTLLSSDYTGGVWGKVNDESPLHLIGPPGDRVSLRAAARLVINQFRKRPAL